MRGEGLESLQDGWAPSQAGAGEENCRSSRLRIPVSLCFQGTGVLACLRGVWDGGDTGAEVSEVVAEA